MVYDEHVVQTTQKVKQIVEKECRATLVSVVPPGATSKIQPLDVAFNAEIKRNVDRQAAELIAKDPEIFLTLKMTASKRRVLFTK